uniref:CSON003716 protein n=1 Tax=Culicoides sonorensis TaxID=179676 RepID=A0A336MZX4_CULSO
MHFKLIFIVGTLSVLGVLAELVDFNPTDLDLSALDLIEKVYHRGTRQRGDKLLKEYNKKTSYITKQELIKVNFRFPPKKRTLYKQIITHIEVRVHQDGNEGEIKVVSGGINQHMISFDVISKHTKRLFITINVYGKMK